MLKINLKHLDAHAEKSLGLFPNSIFSQLTSWRAFSLLMCVALWLQLVNGIWSESGHILQDEYRWGAWNPRRLSHVTPRFPTRFGLTGRLLSKEIIGVTFMVHREQNLIRDAAICGPNEQIRALLETLYVSSQTKTFHAIYPPTRWCDRVWPASCLSAFLLSGCFVSLARQAAFPRPCVSPRKWGVWDGAIPQRNK